MLREEIRMRLGLRKPTFLLLILLASLLVSTFTPSSSAQDQSIANKGNPSDYPAVGAVGETYACVVKWAGRNSGSNPIKIKVILRNLDTGTTIDTREFELPGGAITIDPVSAHFSFIVLGLPLHLQAALAWETIPPGATALVDTYGWTVSAGGGEVRDWSILEVWIEPPNPVERGSVVAFASVQVSPSGGLPRSLEVLCTVDGSVVGGGEVTVPSSPFTIYTPSWTATTGTHTLVWRVDPNNRYVDPNPANNVKSLSFTVGEPFDFDLTVTPPQQPIAKGGSAVFTIMVNKRAGPDQDIQLTISDPPAGARANLNPPLGRGSFVSTLTITTDASISLGTYHLTVEGSGGGKEHSATITLEVTAEPDFSITISPSDRAVTGASTTFAVTVTSTGGFNSAVNLMVADLPGGVTGTFSENSGIPTFATVLTVATSPSAQNGVYSFKVIGSGGGKVHEASATLNIQLTPTTTTATTPTTTPPSTTPPPSPPPSWQGLVDLVERYTLELIIIILVVVLLAVLLARRGRGASTPTRVSATPRTRLCASCGAEMAGDSVFCPRCGARQ